MKPQNTIYEELKVETYRELLQSCIQRFDNRIAFRFKKEKSAKQPEFIEVSYPQHLQDIQALSSKLLSLGLEKKKIALIGQNHYFWPLSYMSITTGNMVCVPLDYLLPAHEIENLLIRSQAEAILFDAKYQPIMEEIARKNTTALRYFICMDIENYCNHTSQAVGNALLLTNLLAEGKLLYETNPSLYENAKPDKDAMSLMLFTSGTTGNSKAVMLSQNNICSNVSAMTTLITNQLEEDSVLSFLPLHHTFECTATYLFCFYRGFTICYADSLKAIPKNLNEYQITGMVCVPALLEIMYRQIQKTIKNKGLTIPFKLLMAFSNFLRFFHIDLRRKFFHTVLENLGKLRIVIYGSAPVDTKIVKFFETIGISMIQGYGLTETSPVIACESDVYKCPGSCGMPLCNEEVHILEPDAKGIGEIAVKGPNVMLGYYENDQANQEAFTHDGFFRTGDLGFLDKKGFLHITGRKKDVLVLSNGKNIFPQEIEQLLNTSLLIEESFVYLKDQTLSAKLVYSPDNETLKGKNPQEIHSLLGMVIKETNHRLPSYKAIRHFTITTIPLIKTTTQKIKRHEEEKLIVP